MRIVDIVKFNDGLAYVVDEIPKLTYEHHNGGLLIGSDDEGIMYDCLYYGRCGGNPNFGGNYAFGGHKFDLPMKDGSVTHCYGQYWDGKIAECEKAVGKRIGRVVIETKKNLAGSFVFCGMYCDLNRFNELVTVFNEDHQDYTIWSYEEYEKHLKCENGTETQL